ncbi:MAG: PadR family transcriptional regulator [Burkholderiales bacterium]|nr:PadR family transcriptional regulator [Burkholderiales bacterium]
MKLDLQPGMLDMCVLAMLERQDSFAFEIASTLVQRANWPEGQLYPLLRRMMHAGWISEYLVETDDHHRRKYFRIEYKGRDALGDMRQGRPTLAETIHQVVWGEVLA